MKRVILGLTLALLPALAQPAGAQSYGEQRRWDAAQARYRSETAIYQAESDRYRQAQERDRSGYRGGGYYDNGRPGDYRDGPPPGADDPYATDYDASRYYRDDPRYGERRLSENDQVYRGSDGRYYCRRGDGTTGLIIGAAGGGILGNVIDGGRHRGAGTLIGGALGALLGKSVAENSDVRCR